MLRLGTRLLAVIATGLLAACATTTPVFQPDIATINELQDDAVILVNVGTFTTAQTVSKTLPLRANSMHSSYGDSYGTYLQQALTQQLRTANRLSADSTTVITGVLQRNELDASGMNIGTADIAANFIVTQEGQEKYNKTHSIHHEWPSSFVGATAIPDAQLNYVTAVQKLLAEFLNDPDLMRILRPASTQQSAAK